MGSPDTGPSALAGDRGLPEGRDRDSVRLRFHMGRSGNEDRADCVASFVPRVHAASLQKEPPIRPGTQDPYKPAN